MPEEAIFASHAVKYIYSFQSMDFTTSIIMKLLSKKFTRFQNKCRTVIANILLPYKKYIVKEHDEALMCMNIFSFTNQLDLKVVPIIFAYFRSQKGTLTKVLEFAILHGETSDLLPEHFITCLQVLQLVEKNVAVSTGNTNLKFGVQKK
jgi:hypothetical protein